MPTPTPTSDTNKNKNFKNPAAAAAALSHKHKVIYVAVVVGIITGLGCIIFVSRFLANSALCGCGGGKFTGAGLVKEEGGRRSWMRLSSPPSNFGPGVLLEGVNGRLYDEKGIERSRSHKKGVSFEDEDEKVMDIGQALLEDDLRILAYLPPPAQNPITPASSAPVTATSLGLKVGQTLSPAHFATAHLAPTSFFDNDDHDHVVSASASHVSNVSSSGAHSRTKSAPVMSHERRESEAMSSSSSEWDVARAYGGARYDKARSAGTASSVDDREWERNQRMGEHNRG
jgi:hypothetical protein